MFYLIIISFISVLFISTFIFLKKLNVSNETIYKGFILILLINLILFI